MLRMVLILAQRRMAKLRAVLQEAASACRCRPPGLCHYERQSASQLLRYRCPLKRGVQLASNAASSSSFSSS